MINVVKVNKDNVYLLKHFIDNMGSASSTFRYYNSRDIDVIENHLVTLLVLHDNMPIAYGHLEHENNINWLGLCVKSGLYQQGYGTMMMNTLIEEAKCLSLNEIYLTIDKGNIPVNKLYKFGFEEIDSQDSSHIFRLNLQRN